MRVTFLHPGHTFWPGGGVRVVHEYANYLARHGHEVNLIFPCRIDSEPRPLRITARYSRDWWKARVSATMRRTSGKSALRWMSIDPRIKLFFVRGLDSLFIPDADAVVATFWRTAEHTVDYPDRKGEKFYLIQHYETWAGPKERVDRTWLAPLHKVVISRWLCEQGKSLGATQIRHIGNGIDHQQFRITRSKDQQELALLTMYHRQPWKGAHDALAVLHRIHERYRDLRMSMFGVDARAQEIPGWIEYFRNPTPDGLRDLYNRHSIYLGASWAEGWALPPAEAMACGCAFVGTDIGGFREYAIDGCTALLSPPQDRNAMFENVCRIIEDRELRSRLQKAGTEYIKQFTWEKSGALFEKYLHEAVERRDCKSAVVANRAV